MSKPEDNLGGWRESLAAIHGESTDRLTRNIVKLEFDIDFSQLLGKPTSKPYRMVIAVPKYDLMDWCPIDFTEFGTLNPYSISQQKLVRRHIADKITASMASALRDKILDVLASRDSHEEESE